MILDFEQKNYIKCDVSRWNRRGWWRWGWRGWEETPFYGDTAEEFEQKKCGVEQIGNDNNSNSSSSNNTKRRKNGEKIS